MTESNKSTEERLDKNPADEDLMQSSLASASSKPMDPMLESIVSDYFSQAAGGRMLSQSSIQAQKNDLRLFFEECRQGELSPLNLNTSEMQSVIDGLASGYAPSSIARLCSTLRSFYSYLSLRLDQPDPAMTLRAPHLSRALPLWVSAEEFEKTLEIFEADDKGILDKTILMTLYCCGLRVSELCMLEERNVRLDQKLLRVIGKGRKERVIPLPDSLCTQMDEYRKRVRDPKAGMRKFFFVSLKGEKLNRQYVYRLVKKASIQGSLPPSSSPHTLRHSFATRLMEHESDLRSLQELLGHSDISTTQIYTHIDTNRLLSTYDQALPDFGNLGGIADGQEEGTVAEKDAPSLSQNVSEPKERADRLESSVSDAKSISSTDGSSSIEPASQEVHERRWLSRAQRKKAEKASKQ